MPFQVKTVYEYEQLFILNVLLKIKEKCTYLTFLGVASEWFWHQWKSNNSEVIQFMEENYPPNFTYQDFGVELKMEFFDANWFANLVKDAGAK